MCVCVCVCVCVWVYICACACACVFRMVARAAEVAGGGGLVSDSRVLSLLIRIASSSASFGLASACDAIGIAQVRFDLI
jgi:hypothetical protein